MSDFQQALDQISSQIKDCMARDQPGLQRRARSLAKRLEQKKPIDRSLPGLKEQVEKSVAQKQQRLDKRPGVSYPEQLPVSQKREDIAEQLAQHQVIIVCGETGSGKTTQLPKICLELGRGSAGIIGHTQPRRIAARSVATRVAEELKVPLGQGVGFKVRFSDHSHQEGYIKLMTDGILLAEIQSDPDLRQYDTLIIDEAHERSLNIDFLLGYLSQLLPRRPDLKIIITSATIDPERFSKHFNEAPIIMVSGRSFPVEVRYRPLISEDEDGKDRDRQQALLEAVDELAMEGPGDILVFLPGEREIRETAEALRKHHPPHTEILPLYARLSASEQQQVFKDHPGRRIVLSTNVAETSLTVPGIRYVVDTGVARISRYSWRAKVQRLHIEAISQASANQRSGRCGRVAEGICIRLYSEEDFEGRPLFTDAEILRTNLLGKFSYRGFDDPGVHFNLSAVRLLSNVRQVFLQLVRYYNTHNQNEEALSILNEMSKKMPEEVISYPDERMALAVAGHYRRAGGSGDYEKRLQYVIPGRQASRQDLLQIAEYYSLVLRDNKRAEDIYLELIQENPDDVEAYSGLFRIYSGSRQYREGIVLLERWLKSHPEDVRAKRELDRLRKIATSEIQDQRSLDSEDSSKK